MDFIYTMYKNPCSVRKDKQSFSGSFNMVKFEPTRMLSDNDVPVNM